MYSTLVKTEVEKITFKDHGWFFGTMLGAINLQISILILFPSFYLYAFTEERFLSISLF